METINIDDIIVEIMNRLDARTINAMTDVGSFFNSGLQVASLVVNSYLLELKMQIRSGKVRIDT